MGDVGFRSFDELENTFHSSNSELWRFLQVRHCVLSNEEQILQGTTGIRELKIGHQNQGASKLL